MQACFIRQFKTQQCIRKLHLILAHPGVALVKNDYLVPYRHTAVSHNLVEARVIFINPVFSFFDKQTVKFCTKSVHTSLYLSCLPVFPSPFLALSDSAKTTTRSILPSIFCYHFLFQILKLYNNWFIAASAMFISNLQDNNSASYHITIKVPTSCKHKIMCILIFRLLFWLPENIITSPKKLLPVT